MHKLTRTLMAGMVAGALTAPVLAQDVTFEGTVRSLTDKDPRVRLRAVDLLKGEGYLEAAVPLAALVTDPVDDVQYAAIAAELNTFLAQRVTPKKRVGYLVEVRGSLDAEQVFDAGPGALGPRRVPAPVAIALANGALDRTFRLALESLYAFGALAPEVSAADRPAVLQQSGPLLAGLMGAPDPYMRVTALRVVGRVFAHRPGDGVVDERLGDAVIAALNSREDAVRETAMWALGAMKYDRAVRGLTDLQLFYRKGLFAERAYDSLAHIAHESSLPMFVESLNGRDATYRMMAIEGLARHGDRSRHEAIQAVVRAQKIEGILLAGHFANAALGDGPITAIVDAMSRSKLREQARQYLVELAPGRVAAMAALIRPPQGPVRIALIDILGGSGDPAAEAALQPYASDTDPAVALAAQRAIARLR